MDAVGLCAYRWRKRGTWGCPSELITRPKLISFENCPTVDVVPIVNADGPPPRIFVSFIINRITVSDCFGYHEPRHSDRRPRICFRIKPDGDHGLCQHDGPVEGQKESGENVGGGRHHVRPVLFSRAPDKLVEVRRLICKLSLYTVKCARARVRVRGK